MDDKAEPGSTTKAISLVPKKAKRTRKTKLGGARHDPRKDTELELKKAEMALAKRRTTYHFIEVVFGTFVLGVVGVVFNWAKLRREATTDDRKFLVEHLTTVFEEKNPHVRKQRIATLIAIQNRSQFFLEDRLKEAESDVAAVVRADSEQKRLEEESRLAKSDEEKKQAAAKLNAAAVRAAADKKAQEERLAGTVRNLRSTLFEAVTFPDTQESDVLARIDLSRFSEEPDNDIVMFVAIGRAAENQRADLEPPRDPLQIPLKVSIDGSQIHTGPVKGGISIGKRKALEGKELTITGLLPEADYRFAKATVYVRFAGGINLVISTSKRLQRQISGVYFLEGNLIFVAGNSDEK